METTSPSIIIQDIFKSFRESNKNIQVLKGFSWRAYPGEITGLVGENGSGKTTMFNILMGIYQQEHGKIIFSDKLLCKYNKKDNNYYINLARTFCALLPNNPFLPPNISGINVIKEHLLLDGRKPKEIKKILQEIDDVFNISSFWNRNCHVYSCGQAMLLSLARLHSLNRDILLLDEPTSGLDYKNASLIRKWMREEAKKGKTVIISSHLLNDLKQMTKNIILLDDGKKSNKSINSFLNEWTDVENKKFITDKEK